MEVSLHWLTDPEVFRVNRLDAHSDHVCYQDYHLPRQSNGCDPKHGTNGCGNCHLRQQRRAGTDQLENPVN